jgi:uncharacterized protein
MRFVFDWDPTKARANLAKHGVSFDEATKIFLDPFSLTIFDEDHSDGEDRWITLGTVGGAKILLAVHTHVEVAQDIVAVRIISARPATRKEAQQYHRGMQA